MPVCGSGALVCSSYLLIRRAQRARCQAEIPPIVLSRFPEPALGSRGQSIACANSLGQRHGQCIGPYLMESQGHSVVGRGIDLLRGGRHIPSFYLFHYGSARERSQCIGIWAKSILWAPCWPAYAFASMI